jgi:uncharacterized protein
MKLQPDAATIEAATAYGVRIDGQDRPSGLLLDSQQGLRPWPWHELSELNETTLAPLWQGPPEIVLLGTGARHQWLHPRWVAAFAQRGVGIECMDSVAACRTYNVLAGEHRHVRLALLAPPPGGDLAAS